jgi:hypothetical protein
MLTAPEAKLLSLRPSGKGMDRNGIVTLTSCGQHGSEGSQIAPFMLRVGRTSPGAKS